MSNALHWQVKMVMSTDQPTAAPAMPTTVAVPTGPVAVGKRPAELQSLPAPHRLLTRARSWHTTAQLSTPVVDATSPWSGTASHNNRTVMSSPGPSSRLPLHGVNALPATVVTGSSPAGRALRAVSRDPPLAHRSQHLSLHVTSPTGSSVRSLLDKGSALGNRGSHLHRWLDVCLEHRVANSAERRQMQHQAECPHSSVKCDMSPNSVATRRCIASHDTVGLEPHHTGVGLIAITNVEVACTSAEPNSGH